MLQNILVSSHILFQQESFCVAIDAQIFVVLVILVFVAKFFMDFVNKQFINDATTKGIENHILTFIVLFMAIFVAQLAGNRRAGRNQFWGDAMLHAPIFDKLLPSELSFFCSGIIIVIKIMNLDLITNHSTGFW